MPQTGWKTKRTLSWPSNGRECNRCREFKTSENFTPFKGGRNGLYPICKSCRVTDSKNEWANKAPKSKILERCKSRATKKGWDFNLTLEDIPEIPLLCPVFGLPMEGKYSPSLDRIDSSKGYIKGNVQIISTRANAIKNDATPEEILKLALFLNGGTDDRSDS